MEKCRCKVSLNFLPSFLYFFFLHSIFLRLIYLFLYSFFIHESFQAFRHFSCFLFGSFIIAWLFSLIHIYFYSFLLSFSSIYFQFFFLPQALKKSFTLLPLDLSPCLSSTERGVLQQHLPVISWLILSERCVCVLYGGIE